MSRPLDLTGQRFGKLIAVQNTGSNKHGKRLWLCRCDCGNEVAVVGSNLRSGNTTSCGCVHIEMLRERATTHGESKTRLHRIWSHMKERCLKENNKSYPRYGGRGIAVCNEWQRFEPFYEWAMSHGYSDDLTIERLDIDGNYCPENCTWITLDEQANNRSNNHRLTTNGETHTIAEWSRRTGIPERRIWYRIDAGWSVERALTAPVRRITKRDKQREVH